MTDAKKISVAQSAAERNVQKFKDDLGPFVVAAEKTRIPMLFTNARSADDEIVYVNKSLLDLTGHKKVDMLGMPFRCLLVSESDRLHMTPEVIAGKRRGTIELPCRRHDRTVFDASVFSSPVCNDVGELEQYFISLFDLAEPLERSVQVRLRESEMYRHAPGFIALTNGPDHRFTFANTAYEKLVGRQNLIGQRVADALPELAGQGIIELLDKVFRTGERFVGMNTPLQIKLAPDGDPEIRYLDFLYEPVRDASGSIIGLFCEGSDITEVRLVSEKLGEMQAQLMHVSRMNAMSGMAATLAHEINQPLGAIANYASACVRILGQSGKTSAKLHEGLSAIAAASDRAGKIITRLRGMTTRITPIRELFDISDLLKESSQLVRADGCGGASISTKGSSAIFALGDKIQIQQVIVNLLLNACHAAANSNRKGTVIALSTQRDGKPCIVIRDNGRGLPADMINDPFKWRESEKSDGMGIGLSICRTIMEEHGGGITLDETGPSGTSFSFTLPVSA